MLRRQEPAGTTASRLDLVGDEEDAVPAAQLLHAGEEVRRGDHEAALAEHRLDDGRGHVLRVHHRHEGPLHGLQGQPSGPLGVDAPIGIRVRDPVDLGARG